jgi:nitric oxide dioxygenase
MPLTEEQKQILKSTAPMFQEHGKEITSILYKHMIAAHPELLDIFNRTNQKTGTQPLALANTMYLAIENLDNLDVLLPRFLLISHKHRALSVLPKHYPILEKYLLLAIDEFLGGIGDPNMLNAWSAVYRLITGIFMETEKKLYAELGGKHEQGFIPFTITHKETIANGPIVAFTFERSDGRDLHHYHCGQYITVRIKKDGHFHNRHYSLTQPFDGKTYRIAIKQEIDQQPKGVVSNEIINNYKEGDIISLSLPAGSYALIDDAKHHLFIAGGVGITAFVGMILDLNQQNKSDIATLIHCVPTKGHAAFADQMREVLPENQYHLLLQGQHLLPEMIEQNLTPETHVYLCGSVPFMNKVEDYLSQCGHPDNQLHIDAYQPSLSLLKNAVKNQSNTKPI